MIIVKLKGGLGNQMFQYALGRRLSLERRVSLKLDLDWFTIQDKRLFELDQFNIPSDLLLPEYSYKLPPFSRDPKISDIYNKIENSFPKGLRFVIKEENAGKIDNSIFHSMGSKYLKGYWQSEKYFETIKSQIRADFTLRQPLAPQDQALVDEMSANPRSVSMHVRRGDYVTDFKIIKSQLICTPDYYIETMRLMKEKLGDGVVFYVFSDDPDWCRKGVDYPSDFKIVSDEYRSASHELVMMSRCRNAIMANSSFSWWGAWLNKETKNIVIYPAKWIYNHNTPDIPLDNWIAFQHSTKNDKEYIDIPYIKSRYLWRLKAEINLDEPQRFTEKLQWLKIYSRKPIYTALADKVAVRDYVAEKIGSQYLTKAYGIYEKSSEIAWDKLPNKFVLKANHGSKWVIRCTNKKSLDKKRTCQKLDNWLKSNYYFSAREWQYNNISPKILIEEFLEGDKTLGLLDYKVWCFNGKPKYIEVFADRFTSIKSAFYDLDWVKLSEKVTYPMIVKEIPRPVQLDEMIEIADSLADGIPFVRVDLYNFSNRIVFGEMTFTPVSGFLGIEPESFDYFLGQELKLPR